VGSTPAEDSSKVYGDTMVEGLIKEIIRTKRRTIALQITPQAELIIRAPHKAPLETIHRFVREKMFWILAKQRYVRENYKAPVKKRFAEGESFLYLGQPYKLSIVKESEEPLVFEGNKFLILEKYVSAGEQVFAWWYKKEAYNLIRQRVNFYANCNGLKYTKFKITSGKRRLGACSSKGAINFSWRLMMTPMEVIDYVVVHELSHLREHNHSQNFWTNVQGLYPNYRRAKSWIKANGHLLAF
jgi:predicted metal-dependent hydrolase